jgi:hypothetical protein
MKKYTILAILAGVLILGFYGVSKYNNLVTRWIQNGLK